MGVSEPRTPSRGRAASAARTLAIPVAVVLAGAVCAVTLLVLGTLTVPTLRVVAGQEQPEAGPEAPGRPQEPAPEPAPEPGAPAEPTPPTAEPDPVPPSSYTGATTSVGVFRVVVETAYTDPTITNGKGSYEEAPEGWEYHVYRINVTNEGSSPVIFDSSGTVGTTTDGQRFDNDIEAEHTVAHDYFWEEIDPGETVTTHIMFLTPVGTEFADVLVSGQSDLHPE